MLPKIDEKNRNIVVFCAFSVIMLFALILRLKDTPSFPFDFDEGIHGYFSYMLYEKGVYQYVADVHGPFLYYMTAGVFTLLGDSIVTARLAPTLFSVAMILLSYPMRKRFGDLAFLVTSALFAFSPLFIMYSQVCRNDAFLAFFTLAMVVCVLLYLERRESRYLIVGAASLALSFTVKENALITLLIFASFLAVHYLYKILKSPDKTGATREILAEILQNVKKNNSTVFLCTMAFLLIYTLLFTSFLAHPDGLMKSFEGIYFWFDASVYGHTHLQNSIFNQPFHTYLELLSRYELPVLIVAFIGGVYYSFVEKNKFMQFVSYWALASLAIYSFIPYKTPWLSLHMLLPLILVAGGFLGRTFEFLLSEPELKKKGGGYGEGGGRGGRIFAVLIILLLIAGFYTYSLSNISHETNEGYAELEQYVKDVTGEDFETKILIIVPMGGTRYDYHWPLPWYVREYNLWVLKGIPPNVEETIRFHENPIFISPMEYAGYLDYAFQGLGYEKKSFDATNLIVYSPK